MFSLGSPGLSPSGPNRQSPLLDHPSEYVPMILTYKVDR